jgi:hypothetical protein
MVIMMATNRCAWIVAVVGLAPAAWMTDVLVRAHRTYRTRVAAEDALRRQDATEAVTDFRAAAQLAPHSVTIIGDMNAALIGSTCYGHCCPSLARSGSEAPMGLRPCRSGVHST